MVWRPLRSAELVSSAERTGSLADAQAARGLDPLSLAPRQLLASLDQSRHRPALALAELRASVHTQPQNPYSWSGLAEFDIRRHQWLAALRALHRVYLLDPTQDPLGHLSTQQTVKVGNQLSEQRTRRAAAGPTGARRRGAHRSR
jgi:cytochrome c-type biogenesis protein CcmH/NrfG